VVAGEARCDPQPTAVRWRAEGCRPVSSTGG